MLPGRGVRLEKNFSFSDCSLICKQHTQGMFQGGGQAGKKLVLLRLVFDLQTTHTSSRQLRSSSDSRILCIPPRQNKQIWTCVCMHAHACVHSSKQARYLNFFQEEHGVHKRVVEEFPLLATILQKEPRVGAGLWVGADQLTVVGNQDLGNLATDTYIYVCSFLFSYFLVFILFYCLFIFYNLCIYLFIE